MSERPTRIPSPSSIAFEEITPTLFIHRPASPSLISPSNPLPPRFVVLFGWLNAPMRNLAKYAGPYVDRYAAEGTTTVIVKLSKGKTFVAKDSVQEAAMQDLANLLREEHALVQQDVEIARRNQADFDDARVPHGMIVHCFSDGGSTSLAVCLRLLNGKSRARSYNGKHLGQKQQALIPSYPPIRASIHDCSPGLTTPFTASNGFSMHLRKKNYLGYLYLRVIVFLWVGMELLRDWLLGRRNKSQILRHELNDPAYWGRRSRVECLLSDVRATESMSDTSDSEGELTEVEEEGPQKAIFQRSKTPLPPRLYLFTTADKLITPRAIEAHAESASKTAGVPLSYPVEMEEQHTAALPSKVSKAVSAGSAEADGYIRMRRWNTPEHCGIAKVDSIGYWREVGDFLKQSL